MNIEQASSAALAAANGGATVNVIGAPAFGVTCPAFISVSVSPTSVAENGGNITFTLTRTGSTAAALNDVPFSMIGTASFNGTADYTVVTGGAVTFNTGNGTGTVDFAAGSATATITVDPTGDRIDRCHRAACGPTAA